MLITSQTCFQLVEWVQTDFCYKMLSPQCVIYWLVNQWSDSLAAGQEETGECVSIVRLMFWLHLCQHIRLIAAGKKTTTLVCCFNSNSPHLPPCYEVELLTNKSLSCAQLPGPNQKKWTNRSVKRRNINVSPLRIVVLSPLFTMKWVFFPFQIRDVSYVNQWGLAVQQCFDLESEMTEKPDYI